MSTPQLAAYTFLPWVQRGLARAIGVADEPQAPPGPAAPPLGLDAMNDLRRWPNGRDREHMSGPNKKSEANQSPPAAVGPDEQAPQQQHPQQKPGPLADDLHSASSRVQLAAALFGLVTLPWLVIYGVSLINATTDPARNGQDAARQIAPPSVTISTVLAKGADDA